MNDVPEDPARLPNQAVVVRGGESRLRDMKKSVCRLLCKQRRRGQPEQPALSVFTDAELDAAGIVQQAPILRGWSKVRLSTVGELRQRGFEVPVPDSEDGHTSVKLPQNPTDDDYERFIGAFAEAIPRP